MLTARAHNFLYANPSLEDTISRLQAFEKAGADVLFAPGLPDLPSVSAVCAAASKPFNFMAGIKGKSFSVTELAAAGVRRISLATSLYRELSAVNRLIVAEKDVPVERRYSFPVGIFTREVKAPPSSSDLWERPASRAGPPRSRYCLSHFPLPRELPTALLRYVPGVSNPRWRFIVGSYFSRPDSGTFICPDYYCCGE
jgi:hypothetical protein